MRVSFAVIDSLYNGDRENNRFCSRRVQFRRRVLRSHNQDLVALTCAVDNPFFS